MSNSSMYFIKTHNSTCAIRLVANENKHWNVLSVILLVIFVVLVVFYILEVNSIATQGYEIKTYNKKIENFEIDNQRLFLEKSRLSSFESVKLRISALNLLESREMSYLDIFESTVALGK